jgi:hypothetical protein
MKNNIKDKIFEWKNFDQEKGFLSLIFSDKIEQKNKFYISNLKQIIVYEINNEYNGVAQQNLIQLDNNIIHIGFYINDVLYAIMENNEIKLFCNDISDSNNKIKNCHFKDSIILVNNKIERLQDQKKIDFILNYKNRLSIFEGNIVVFNNNIIYYIQIMSLEEGITLIYESLFNNNIVELWDILFYIGNEIINRKNPIWKIDNINKFKELFQNYSYSYISYLIVEIIEKLNDEVITNFNKLISFLFDIKLYNILLNGKNN